MKSINEKSCQCKQGIGGGEISNSYNFEAVIKTWFMQTFVFIIWGKTYWSMFKVFL